MAEDGRIDDLRVLLVTNNYPSRDLPHVGTFVAALVETWAAGGTEVAVAAPGSSARNIAFDVTPARLISGLITDRGVCEASASGLAGLFPNKAG